MTRKIIGSHCQKEEVEGMNLLLGNYGEAMEAEILQPYEARMYLKK